MANAFLVRPLALAAVSAEGSAAGTSPANLANDYRGLVHRGTAVGPNPSTGYVAADLGAAADVDFATLLSTNLLAFHEIRMRGGASAEAAAGSGGALADTDWTAALAGSAFPVSGRGHSWSELSAAVAARYWRLEVRNLAGLPVEAARLVIGKKLQFGRNYSFGLSPGVGDTGAADFTPANVLMRRRGVRFRTLDIEFSSLTTAEVEESLLPLLELVGATEPVLIVTDPAPHAMRARRMYFGLLESGQKSARLAFDRWQWRGTLRSLL